MTAIEQFARDLRFGLRFLRRNPRFVAVVIATLAVGIGMNTAVFSVVNTVLLKPLSYPNPERLVWFGYHDPNIQRDVLNMQEFFDVRARARLHAGMAAYGYQPVAIATATEASQVTAVYVAGDFWKITGAQAASGHLFPTEESDCLVLSWDLFEQQFGARKEAIGKPVMVNGRPFRVTGVLTKDFRFQFPAWWTANRPESVKAYISLPPAAQRTGQTTQALIALKPGVSLGQARAELESLSNQIRKESGRPPATNLRVEPLQHKLTGGIRQTMIVLLAAGGLVLLIASVNVANLLLARGTVRQKEIAIRIALGARRMRIVRQLLVESIALALASGVVGLLLARWSITALIRISPYAVPRLSETAIDLRVLAFTLSIAILTGILFGLGPSIALWRTDLQSGLKDCARSSTGSGGHRTRRLLAAVEIALAVVLLTEAGLMLKSFARMSAFPPGFDPANVIVMKVRFPTPRGGAPSARESYLREIVRRIETAPVVKSAGISTWFLFSGAPAFPADTIREQTRVIRVNAASTGYLKTLGMSLVRGRWLANTDTGTALLNQSMARQAFGGLDPIGRQLLIPQAVTIVGILADVKYSKLDAEATPEVFVGYQEAPFLWGGEIAARMSGDSAAFAPALRKLISDIDPSVPVYDVKTLEMALAESIAPRRFNLFLMGAFALSALVLALIGIYGVVAYSVAQRTREIGVRMALGARRGQVAALVIREALLFTVVGAIMGLAASWGIARLMATLLYDVKATDPQIFATVAILLAVTALAACVAPILKATSIEPTAALRSE